MYCYVENYVNAQISLNQLPGEIKTLEVADFLSLWGHWIFLLQLKRQAIIVY